MGTRMRYQLQALFPLLLGLYASTLVVILIFILIGFQLNIPITNLTRDPAAITGESPFLGGLSYVGVLMWCAATAICLFCFAVLQKKNVRGDLPSFFLFGGLFTLILLLDDLYLLHELVFPVYLNIPEKLTFLIYGLMALGYLVRFRKLILQTDFIVLALALGFFGSSIIVDLLDLVPTSIEDGLKILGIVGWFGYFSRTGFQMLEPIRVQQAKTPEKYFS